MKNELILIFDKKGKYFDEASTVSKAAELTDNLDGNVSQIINNFPGHNSANGYYFLTISREATTKAKNYYIDKVEEALSLLIICCTKTPLADKVDEINRRVLEITC